MRITRHRAIAAATAAAIALSSMAITPASAGSYRYHNGAGNAAVLGAVAGVFGAIALMAAHRHHERHRGYGAYGYAPQPAPYGYYGHGHHHFR